MKKALIIVAVVAGYCLIETFLLLSMAVPRTYFSRSSSSTSEILNWLSPFLFIPGLAATFSCIIYGSYHWLRRVLRTL